MHIWFLLIGVQKFQQKERFNEKNKSSRYLPWVFDGVGTCQRIGHGPKFFLGPNQEVL
jgi:hypothetical protein